MMSCFELQKKNGKNLKEVKQFASFVKPYDASGSALRLVWRIYSETGGYLLASKVNQTAKLPHPLARPTSTTERSTRREADGK